MTLEVQQSDTYSASTVNVLCGDTDNCEIDFEYDEDTGALFVYGTDAHIDPRRDEVNHQNIAFLILGAVAPNYVVEDTTWYA